MSDENEKIAESIPMPEIPAFHMPIPAGVRVDANPIHVATHDEQLACWRRGEAAHCVPPAKPFEDAPGEECLPDFSCCYELRASDAEIDLFIGAHEAGDRASIDRMLGVFLSRMMRMIGSVDVITASSSDDGLECEHGADRSCPLCYESHEK